MIDLERLVILFFGDNITEPNHTANYTRFTAGNHYLYISRHYNDTVFTTGLEDSSVRYLTHTGSITERLKSIEMGAGINRRRELL